MSKGRDRSISRRKDGSWENKRNDASKASSVHKTQKEAEQDGRKITSYYLSNNSNALKELSATLKLSDGMGSWKRLYKNEEKL